MFSQNPYKHIHGNRSFDQTDGYGSTKIILNERKIPKASCSVWRKSHVIYALVTVIVNIWYVSLLEDYDQLQEKKPLYM